MIAVTKRLAWTNQDIDEQQRILTDLSANPRDYLAHADSEVRSLADWVMHDFGIRVIRDCKQNRETGHRNLSKLYNRLRDLA